MPTINFTLRKKEGRQAIYFRFRPTSALDILLATPFSIETENWDSVHQRWNEDQIKTGAKTIETKNKNNEIQNFNRNLNDLKNKVERFISENLDKTSDDFKPLLKAFVQSNYFAHRIAEKKESQTNKNIIPNKFSDLIDYYIEYRSVEDKTQGIKPLAVNTVKKYTTLKNTLVNYDKTLLATDINDAFRNEFIQYLNRRAYSENQQIKFIKDIKMLCVFANKKLSIDKQVLSWKINANPTNVSESPALNFADLEKLKGAQLTTAKLQNVRDWFLISCYTSVRVSELMVMQGSEVEKHGDDYFITVVEQKNQNKLTGTKIIYLMPQVIQILNTRSGNFPKPISHQKYNEYLKELFEVAGFTHEIECGIIENTPNGKRKVRKFEKFCKAVSSHSGRATYVTLFSGKLPSEIIQMQTNHQSKEMVDHYNKTDKMEKLLRKAKMVAQAHKDIEEEYNSTPLLIKSN